MFTTKIFLAGMSRADLTKPQLAQVPGFYLYIDEFQNLANDSFADILAQARKYKLNLTLAHQYIEQMPETVRAAVFGNVGTLISFRVGATDAEVLSREFAEVFTVDDFVSLGIGQVYLSLMIDGIGSSPFSASTLLPLATPAVSMREEVIENSRKVYARSRPVVEAEISGWMSESDTEIREQKKKDQNNKHQGAKVQSRKTEKPKQEKAGGIPLTDEMKADLPGATSFKDALKNILGQDKGEHMKMGNKKEEVAQDTRHPKQEQTPKTQTPRDSSRSKQAAELQTPKDHQQYPNKNKSQKPTHQQRKQVRGAESKRVTEESTDS